LIVTPANGVVPGVLVTFPEMVTVVTAEEMTLSGSGLAPAPAPLLQATRNRAAAAPAIT
jgi:hypothetical protein